MNQESDVDQRPLVIHIPQMHPELAGHPLPPAVRFFNPGLIEAEAGRYFVCAGLPLNPKQAGRALRTFQQLSDQFQRPGDMTAYARSEFERWNRFPGMSEPEAADLDKFISQRGDSALPRSSSFDEHFSPLALVHSQQVLLLAWSMEARILDLQGVSGKYRDALNSFGQALGLEEGDVEDDHGGLVEFSRTYPDIVEDMAPPWRLVVEHMAHFLAQGTVLLTSRPELRRIWEERGVVFESCSTSDLEILHLSAERGGEWRRAVMGMEDLTDGMAEDEKFKPQFMVFAPADSGQR